MSARTLLMASALAAGATSAAGATVTINSVRGDWRTPVGGENVTGVGTKELRWGFPAESENSGFGFDGGAPPKLGPEAEDTPFTLGTFTHFNNPVYGVPMRRAQLRVVFDVTITADDGTEVRRQDFTSYYRFNILETPNEDAVCPNGGANGKGLNVNGCADRVRAELNRRVSDSVAVGGEELFLVVSGFKVGDRRLTEFWTREHATTEAELRGELTSAPAPAPLPAAGWLLLGGLGALGALRRRG